MRRIRFWAVLLSFALVALTSTGGCGGAVYVSDNDASVKVPPGQVRKEMTPGHNK